MKVLARELSVFAMEWMAFAMELRVFARDWMVFAWWLLLDCPAAVFSDTDHRIASWNDERQQQATNCDQDSGSHYDEDGWHNPQQIGRKGRRHLLLAGCWTGAGQ